LDRLPVETIDKASSMVQFQAPPPSERLSAIACAFLLATSRRNEAISLSRDGLYEPGPLRIILEHLTNFADRAVDAVVSIEEDAWQSVGQRRSAGGCQLGVRYESTGKPLEAISEYQKAVELSDGDLDATASLAHAFAVIGKRVEAKKILGDLVRAKNRKPSMFLPISGLVC
jgi:tetratricopeptide (TPR) repeat protein